MSRYVCMYCGHIHDEAEGAPEHGIAPGTPWAEVPDDWECPGCGAEKSAFIDENA